MSDTLLLNADGQPVSFLPLSAIQWKEAILYMYLDKVTVMNWYDDWMVRSTTWETRVPSVIMLKEYMHKTRKPRFSKGNLYLRDMYECVYCGCSVSKATATMDHVLPLSHGGKTNWENIVTACAPCNHAKGNNKAIRPQYKPHAPGYYELVRKRKQLGIEVRHPSWTQWLDLDEIIN
jgi:5-methylcytosine-specific restriction endonuclease McrA